MHGAMCLLISFIVLGSLVISSAGMFLPMDEHPIWEVFAVHPRIWSASAMLSCGIFFMMAFTLIDEMDDESGVLELSSYPFASFLLLAAAAPPLAQFRHFGVLKLALAMMAAMAWTLMFCVGMLFGWGVLSAAVGLLALHCSAVAFASRRVSLN